MSRVCINRIQKANESSSMCNKIWCAVLRAPTFWIFCNITQTTLQKFQGSFKNSSFMWSRQAFITSVSHPESLTPRSSYPTARTPNGGDSELVMEPCSHVAVRPESLFSADEFIGRKQEKRELFAYITKIEYKCEFLNKIILRLGRS